MIHYQAVMRENRTYLACLPDGALLESEREALELIEGCIEHHTDRVMVFAANLPKEFYDLKTGVAGGILQKFAQYRVRIAAILTAELVGNGRFSEMVLEANRGSHFRVFYEREKAEVWLLGN